MGRRAARWLAPLGGALRARHRAAVAPVMGAEGEGADRGAGLRRERPETVIFSLPFPLQARVVAQGRSERHDRTTPVKWGRAGAILFLAVSDQGDPGD